MLKASLSALAVALLCGRALAAESTYQVDFALSIGDVESVYTILVSDGTCGETTVKADEREDVFRVCAEPVGDGRVRLDVERQLRDGKNESSTHAVVLATPGSSYEVLDTTMTVTVQ